MPPLPTAHRLDKGNSLDPGLEWNSYLGERGLMKIIVP